MRPRSGRGAPPDRRRDLSHPGARRAGQPQRLAGARRSRPHGRRAGRRHGARQPPGADPAEPAGPQAPGCGRHPIRQTPAAEASMSAARDGFVHPEYLIETDELAARLGDPNLVVLDSTTHLIPDPKTTYTVKPGREDFEKGHIPGAQFVDLQADLSDNSGRYGKLRFMLPSAEDFAAAMSRF